MCAFISVASGCLTTDAHLDVNDNGSGELRLEVFPPPEISDQLDRALGTAGVEKMARDALNGIESATFESGERQGQTFYNIKVPFDDVRNLTSTAGDGANVAGARVTPFSQFDLRKGSDGGWTLQAVTNPLAGAVSFGEGSPLAGLVQMAATEDAGSGVELSVTLPGRLTDSNADTQEDNTARWRLSDPAATYTLTMQTESTPTLSPIQWLLIGLLAIFVVGGILMFVGGSGPVKRRSLRKPSRREHEAFLTAGDAGRQDQPKGRPRRARRRKTVVAQERTGWESPGPTGSSRLDAPQSGGLPSLTDPSGTSPFEGGAQEVRDDSDLTPNRPLQPFTPQSPSTPPGDHAGDESVGESVPAPDPLLPGPESDPDQHGGLHGGPL